MRSNCLPIYLDNEAYQTLEQRARDEERDPIQQARWMLKQALETNENKGSTSACENGG